MEEVLSNIYNTHKRIQGFLYVSAIELQRAGWNIELPTIIFSKYGSYWIRFMPTSRNYKIVRVVEEDLVKGENALDPNRPLVLPDVPRINLRDMMKQQIKNNK